MSTQLRAGRGIKTAARPTSGCQPLLPSSSSSIIDLDAAPTEIIDVDATASKSASTPRPSPPKRKRRTKKEMEESRHLHRLDGATPVSSLQLSSAEEMGGSPGKRCKPNPAYTASPVASGSGSGPGLRATTRSPRSKKAQNHQNQSTPNAADMISSQKEDIAASGEKRLARYRPKMPADVAGRVFRVLTQRMMMISRKRQDHQAREADVVAAYPSETFAVLGSVGNVYTVTIDRQPSCTCPDALKGQICKHILFIYLKVLGLSQTSPLIYQKALLSEELISIFETAKADPAAIAQDKLRELYEAKLSGDAAKITALEEKYQKRKKISEDDLCPVCFCDFEEADATNVYCQTCGNPCHKACFDGWEQARRKQGQSLTCVYCRAPWVARKSQSPTKSNYLNLAQEAGIEQHRDTTTYYHGPRRGYRRWENYGNRYDDDDDDNDGGYGEW